MALVQPAEDKAFEPLLLEFLDVVARALADVKPSAEAEAAE